MKATDVKSSIVAASKTRLFPALVVGVVLLGVIIGIWPSQAGTIGRKIGLVALGLWLGYAAYKMAYRVIPTDDERVLMVCKAWLMGITALCLALAV